VPRATGASARDWIARSFTHVEDVLYVGLGVLLAAGALALLADATLTFVTNLLAGTLPARIISLLDRVLLVLMFAGVGGISRRRIGLVTITSIVSLVSAASVVFVFVPLAARDCDHHCQPCQINDQFHK